MAIHARGGKAPQWLQLWKRYGRNLKCSSVLLTMLVPLATCLNNSEGMMWAKEFRELAYFDVKPGVGPVRGMRGGGGNFTNSNLALVEQESC